MKTIYKKAALLRARLIKKYAKKNLYTNKSFVILRVYDKEKHKAVYKRFNYINEAIKRYKVKESFIYIPDMKLGLSYRELAIKVSNSKTSRVKQLQLEYYTVPKYNN